MPAAPDPGTVFTVGHSTRTLEDLVALLREAGATALVDVRRWPRSRHNPQFDREELERELPRRGIAYFHRPELGGWRRARADSPNTGLRSPGFRGYADHMLSEEFQRALDELVELARQQPAAIMCAELVPERCHRSFIADALVARGLTVHHLLSEGRSRAHAVRPQALVRDGRVLYPGGEGEPG